MKYFVHRYDVVRVKVAVEAESHAEAMEKADDYLARNHPIGDRYHTVPGMGPDATDEAIADFYRYPTWLHYEEPGQEVTGYLVDEVGDEGYKNSRSYDDCWNPIHSGWDDQPDFPIADWKYQVANGDTRLGYVKWVSNQRVCAKEG